MSWDITREHAALPAHFGPYQTGEVLGRGGMGVVCRGRHEQTGAAVAIKTIRDARESMLAGIRREIHALGQLHHPGVVTVIDHGVSAGVPWYAMPLLTGTTLRALIRQTFAISEPPPVSGERTATQTVTALISEERSPRRPSAPVLLGANSSRLIRVLSDVCDALNHVHTSGVVHRDLKPDNIFVLPDGAPMLVDFGIAGHFGGSGGREQLDVPDGAVGTLAYVAPEQVRGELVDARADLYALGCMLYECLTGEPPFAGAGPQGAVYGHLHRTPLPPSLVVPAVPPALDQLVLRLLEKRPEDRLGYADEVAQVLRAYLADGPSPVSQSLGTPYLYRPAFVGRDAAFVAISDSLLRVANGQRGGSVYIGGESGVGKTRVAIEAVSEARRKDVVVVSSQCTRLDLEDARHESHALPLAVFGPLLLAAADHCRSHAEETSRLLHPDGKLLVGFEPLLALVPGFASLPEPGQVEPRAARERIKAAVLKVVIGLAQLRPTIFVIDDLQWADELSLEVLAELATDALSAQGPLVIATYRSDEASTALQAITQSASVTHLELDRFTQSDVSRMVRGMLALDASPPAFVELLHQKSGGNPVFVVEYLRAAIGEGLLSRRNGRWQLGPRGDIFDLDADLLGVPAGLGDLVRRRLRHLEARVQRLVQAAAVLGREFDAALLASCTSFSEQESHELLAMLHRRQILEDAADGGLRFVHDAIREAAYEEVPRELAAELHRRAAVTLRERVTDAPRTHRVVAHHFGRAGLCDESASHYALGAQHARKAYANDDAMRLFGLALEQLARVSAPAARDAIVENRESLADLQCLAGLREEARANYGAALAHTDTGARRARIARKTGKSWELDGRFDSAKEHYRTGEAELEQSEPRDTAWWREWLDIQLDHVWANYWTGNMPEMQRLIGRVGDTADVHGTPVQRAQFYHSFTLVRAREERYRLSPGTVDYARRAMAAGNESGDPTQIALIRFGLGFALLFNDQLAEAETTLQRAAEEASLIGDRALHSRVLTYLMMTARRRGLVEPTLALATQMGAVARRTRMKDYVGAAQANVGWASLKAGALDEARLPLQEAVDAWASPPSIYPFEWLALVPLLALHQEAGDEQACRRDIERLLRENQQALPESLARKLLEAGRAEAALLWPQLSDALAEAAALGFI